MSVSSVGSLEAGRDALNRHAWKEAFDLLVEADREGPATAQGLEMLADAAWWSGQPGVAIEALERAYAAYLGTGNRSQAAMMALQLARQHATRLEISVATGWMARADRLVIEDPNSPVRGYLAWVHGSLAMHTQADPAAAVAYLDQALDLARQSGDRNVEAMSLQDKGRALCWQGKLGEGLALMDEAMATVVGGELDPGPTGYVYCQMISSCSSRADYLRASEWTEATSRWAERNKITGFPGICRVHRAEIMKVHGSWAQAEEEARQACEEMPSFNLLFALGDAFFEIGEVRRLMGDFVGAEEAYSRAHEYGKDPQPGLALIRLAQGKLDSAVAGVRRALADESRDRFARVKPLAAQVRISIAAGDLDTATKAVAELEGIAGEVVTTALQAEAIGARGELRLAEGDLEGAIHDLLRARHGWQEVDAPYEVAEVRLLLGRAYKDMGDQDGALQELRAARDAFDRLGAAFALDQVDSLLKDHTRPGSGRDRAKRAFVFTDIVKSTDLVRAIGDEAWEDLLSWHDQLLRSMFDSHGAQVANNTGDGFFATFGDVDTALSCAVAIQKALADHRRTAGFAPMVRIGVHAGEATSRGGQDYGGGEVHKAARIGALAAASEIVASEEALAEAGAGFRASDLREVELKGISEPVRVATIEWR